MTPQPTISVTIPVISATKAVFVVMHVLLVLAFIATPAAGTQEHSKQDTDLAAATASAQGIQHVVVVMLENRPFDHMLGWLPRDWGRTDIDGLTGAEYNTACLQPIPFPPAQNAGAAGAVDKREGTIHEEGDPLRDCIKGDYFVAPTCPYVNPFDPSHSAIATFFELMGNSDQLTDPAPMSGFVQWHVNHSYEPAGIVMTGFSPDRVPVISSLATEFAVFDRYFASVAGPTDPNRIFMHANTAYGKSSFSSLEFWPGIPTPSVFSVLESKNVSWGVYFEDYPDTLALADMRTDDALAHYHWYDTFLEDAASENLPFYSWISPRFYPDWNGPARDQHPDHDVVQGEIILAEIYEAVRNGPNWNNTLLLITYDEHGGFYDHVSPPAQFVPNPDGRGNATANNDLFTRLGVRVPMIAVSPRIPRGTVVHAPPLTAPFQQFEHCSVFSTLRALLGLDWDPTTVLSNRTNFAAPFDFLLYDEEQEENDDDKEKTGVVEKKKKKRVLRAPRDDAPPTLRRPEAAFDRERTNQQHATELASAANDLQLGYFVTALGTLCQQQQQRQNVALVPEPPIQKACRHMMTVLAATAQDNNDHNNDNDVEHSASGAAISAAVAALNRFSTTSTTPTADTASTLSQAAVGDAVRSILQMLVPPPAKVTKKKTE